ncbi:MAG: hypothetical protein R6W85_05655 [Gillisia sp.]
MEDKAVYEIEEIKAKLIECCINCSAREFLPYLLSPLITADFPNKIRFYGFLKSILKSAGKESEGVLDLRIEREAWDDENVMSYNFYDEVHKYPRINLKVKEVDNKLHLDLMPF